MHQANWRNKGFAAAVALLVLSGCAGPMRSTDYLSAPMKQYLESVVPTAEQQTYIDQYRKFEAQKAIALTQSGDSGYGYAGSNLSSAVRSALSQCQKYSPRPCRVYMLNQTLYQDQYAEFARRSADAIASMAIPAMRDYHLEAIDWRIPQPSGLRELIKEPYEAATPTSLTGIQTIRTVELAHMLKQDKPVMIDARGWGEERVQTIPGAFLIDWGGAEQAHIPGREDKMRKDFEVVMQLLEPDKTRPIVVFCHAANCWLSVNAALRLQAIGYSNIHWYRGGMEAWKSADLPLIPAVPHATLWSP